MVRVEGGVVIPEYGKALTQGLQTGAALLRTYDAHAKQVQDRKDREEFKELTKTLQAGLADIRKRETADKVGVDELAMKQQDPSVSPENNRAIGMQRTNINANRTNYVKEEMQLYTDYINSGNPYASDAGGKQVDMLIKRVQMQNSMQESQLKEEARVEKERADEIAELAQSGAGELDEQGNLVVPQASQQAFSQDLQDSPYFQNQGTRTPFLTDLSRELEQTRAGKREEVAKEERTAGRKSEGKGPVSPLLQDALDALNRGEPPNVDGLKADEARMVIQRSAQVGIKVRHKEEELRRFTGVEQTHIKTSLQRFEVSTRRILERQQGMATTTMLIEGADKNPIFAGAIPTLMARLSGEVGNLAEHDKKPFGGSRSILRQIEAIGKIMAVGTISDANRTWLLELVDVMDRGINAEIDRFALKESKRLSLAKNAEGHTFLIPKTAWDHIRPNRPFNPRAGEGTTLTGEVKEVRRKTRDGKWAIYNAATKKYIRMEEEEEEEEDGN